MTHPRTSEEISAITRQPCFQSIPNRLVSTDTYWYDMQDALSRFGVDTYTWELAHYIAQVFDVYERIDTDEPVDCIHVSWTTAASNNQVFLQCQVQINDRDVSLAWQMLDDGGDFETVEIQGMSELTEQMRSLDDKRALEEFYRTADDAPQPLVSQLDLLNTRFAEVSSAAQARQIAQDIDPRVLAALSKMGLSAQTDHPAPSASRPSPRM